jgi:hypothetical protein
MSKTQKVGWPKLVEGYPWFEGAGNYPLPAYSEFMPSPRVGISLYGGEIDHTLFATDDPYGWRVPEIEEEYQLRPGLAQIAKQVLGYLTKFGRGEQEYRVVGHNRRLLDDNPYWSPDLDARLGSFERERYVTLMPVALTKTQDYLGRVRWTLFGASEQGPERAFWQSFYTAPRKEIPVSESVGFVSNLLSSAYGEATRTVDDLLQLGFRILPAGKDERFPYWNVDPLPKWTQPFLIDDNAAADDINYLLTFRPFSKLPAPFREKYLAEKLALLPSPFTLIQWGMQIYRQAVDAFPLAMQYPLMPLVARHDGAGIRVPQSAWLSEPDRTGKTLEIAEELVLNSYKRTHRWDRVRRDEDALEQSTRVATVTQAIFSTALADLDLYNKPLARNVQLWTPDGKFVLDGPRATREDIQCAAKDVLDGGVFRYFFRYPAMLAGKHGVFWHRPLAAYWSRENDEIKMLDARLPGYFTAYDSKQPDLARPIELYPRLLARPAYLSALRHLDERRDHYRHQTALNILTILDMAELWHEPRLPRSLARQMLRMAKDERLRSWLDIVRERATQPSAEQRLIGEIERRVEKTDRPLPDPITYHATATRAFEEAYWNDISSLAHGKFVNKVNSDVVQDEPTKKRIKHPHRDLHALGDYLIERHQQAIAAAGMEGRAFVGELPFKWETDFDFPQYDGWVRNQEGKEYERNILVVIPGKNRGEAVVMGDHYDTAYMEDYYYDYRGGDGSRIGAHGADDNDSATATLLQGAPIFLQLAKEGKLERDVWLIHLTGEEFPSDCMGARVFCQALIEKTLKLRLVEDDRWIDLSQTKVVGALVMDMIGHNRDNARNIFQISPGKSAASLRLAYQAHLANEVWNAKTVEWNQRPERQGRGSSERSADPKKIPAVVRHPQLDGEVRTFDNPQSSVFNTDVQIFSDIGAPCILVMEDYDISRTGYHDTHDTVENIDLDYASALSAICIETMARVAMVEQM